MFLEENLAVGINLRLICIAIKWGLIFTKSESEKMNCFKKKKTEHCICLYFGKHLQFLKLCEKWFKYNFFLRSCIAHSKKAIEIIIGLCVRILHVNCWCLYVLCLRFSEMQNSNLNCKKVTDTVVFRIVSLLLSLLLKS